jgi:O-antigen/teichoic acid export membrane protein
MSTAKRVMVNSSFLYMKMALTLFLSLYTTRVILSALGRDDFGLYTVIAGFTVMLTFFNTTLASSSQRFMAVAQGENLFSKQLSVFNISILLHILAALIIGVLLIVSGFYIFDGFLNIQASRIESAKIVYNFVILTTLFSILSVPFDAAVNAHEKMIFLAILGFCESILKLIAALVLTYLDLDKLILYGSLLSIISFLLFMSKAIYVSKNFKEAKFSPKKYYDKTLFKEMLTFSGWGFLTGTVAMITGQGQNILINIYFGTAVNAAQGIAGQVVGQVGSITNVFLTALKPVIFKSEGAANKTLLLQSIKSGSKIAFMSFALIAIPIIIEMDFLFKFWLKTVPDYAVIFCRILLVTYILAQLTITLNTAISATGRIKNFTIFFSIAGLTPIIVSFILFRNGYSVTLLYIIYLVYEILRSSFLLYFAKIIFGLSIKDYLNDVIFKCLSIMILVVPVLLFINYKMDESFIRLGFVFLCSIGLNCIMYYFWGLSNREKEIITNLFYNVKSSIIRKIR